MIVAIGYLSWSRQEIKANLQQAQINQSEFLCNRARELSEDGDRIRAIQLVMEALPSEEVDRPLSRGALNNLVQVLHAYSPKGSADRNRAVDTCASFETQGRIKDFKTRDDGKYFFALDENGMLYVWDSRSYEKVLEMGPRTDEKTVGKVMDAAFIEDEALVLYTADGISAFSLPEGNEIWKYTEPSVDWELSGMVRASGSPEIIAALVSERTETGEDGKAAGPAH